MSISWKPRLTIFRRWRWQRTVRRLEHLRSEENKASGSRKGPPTDEERIRLQSLAKRGRTLAERETRLRKRGI